MTSPEQQLEFFDAVSRPIAATRRHGIGPVRLQVRQDQAMVAGVAALIGIAIIFAFGVERGKLLVRAERSVLARRPVELPELPAATTPALTTPPIVKAEAPAVKSSATPAKPKSSANATTVNAPKKVASSATPAGSAKKPAKDVKNVKKTDAGNRSRYAVQLVSFSKPQLARRELERLQAKGERAFLVIRNGVTVVCAGPFPSKANAAEKLTGLKPRYQDCFIKTL